MAPLTRQTAAAKAWDLVGRQHGVITHWQLVKLGFSSEAIAHRIATGRLHPIHRGVYAAGRPDVGTLGVTMAAVLACGDSAVASHLTAASMTGITASAPRDIHVSIEGANRREHPGIVVHRRLRRCSGETGQFRGIPITAPLWTLIDIAGELTDPALERAINEADKRGLIRVGPLRAALEQLPGRAGVGRLKRILDIRTFVLTDSELERLFNPLARRAGLAKPQTGIRLDGYKVDFYWPDLDLVVETDGFGFHRTPSQMTWDAERMQAHVAAGRTVLRFSHGQIRYEPKRVAETLLKVAELLSL